MAVRATLVGPRSQQACAPHGGGAAAALYLLVPLLVAAAPAGVVQRYGMRTWLKRPIDAGMTVRGRHLFGDHTTWRGACHRAAQGPYGRVHDRLLWRRFHGAGEQGGRVELPQHRFGDRPREGMALATRPVGADADQARLVHAGSEDDRPLARRIAQAWL